MQDRFFIYNAVIDIPLKKNSYIIFEYGFNSEYIDIPLIVNLKIDNVLEKDFNINLKEYNKIRHMFKLDYNITKINFYLYLFNNEIYNDQKMKHLKKILFNNKKLNLIYFLIYRYMNYYRKPINKTVDGVKLKMQIGALTLKLSENNGNISKSKTDISSNLSKIIINTSDISSNLSKINTNTSLIDTNRDNIASNLTMLNNIDIDLASLRGRINTHQNNIQNINSNINAIEENNLKISDEVFNNRYNIINQSFNLNKNTHSYQLFEKVIENNMVSGELTINAIINYKYNDLKNDIKRLCHLYQIYNDKNELFYSITLDNHDFGVPSNSDKNILNVSDNFCFNINNKDKIKLVLSLSRINEWGIGNINLQMIDNNSINIIYKEKTNVSDKFDENDKKIKAIDDKISSNNNLISNNFTSILPLKTNYVIDNIWLFNLNSNKDINFKSDIKKILVYENNIDYQFKVNSFIEINESITYKYDNIKLYYYVLKEKYILMDQNDIILDEFNFNIKSKGVYF